ncbi:MAG: IPT/TIG domain-containing protein [Myxococcota bacterium]|nr:IPT/TIG domain-containing protein [Myxococcota bacterium]
MLFLFLSNSFAATPQELANAMSIPATDVVSQTLTADASATAVLTETGVIYPTDGNDFSYLYTGSVGVAPQSGTDLGSYGESGDRTTFTVQLLVPPTANSALFDFYFLSAEYPEFVGTEYNDKFEANVTGTAYSGNAATDSLGNMVDVNSAFFTVVNDIDLQGTGFDAGAGGGTGWLTMIVPVDPGDTVTFSFTIYDVADGIYDSAVLLDGFDWSTTDVDEPIIVDPIILDYISPKRSQTEGGIVTNIYGEDFNSTCLAYFDGIESPSTTYIDPTRIQAEVPPHDVGIVDVEVVCDSAQDKLQSSFTYYEDSDGAEPPSILSVEPYQHFDSGGETVVVSGIDFVSGAVLDVDGVEVETEFVDVNTLKFIAPAHALGFADVRVVNPDGLYDDLSGAMYYVPSPDEPEPEDEVEDTTDMSADSDVLEGDGAPKDTSVGSCSHFSSPKEGLGFILMILGVLAWRKK